ncbi:iron complex transport system permease protein [Clostridium cavendishii DSM 21758]|uniref:Iron complex transport system permease protein n=1 Tax=Clostridium cavendishii DSM 21758 TaxID=1121302 RepID=A0A1M6UMC7_9CLOT|nr:ABC transporter permease [Clostridium cavendishii]SHK70288.1 iron complex transport system permease protein [Clostridium cavendishii DSM 21758]
MKKIYLVLILVILSVASIFIGVSDISIFDVLNTRTEKFKILLISRIPRLISIIVAGISMSITGLIMQQITKNKFVSPSTAATIDSAKLGILVALMMFTGATSIQKMIISFVFALAGTFIFMKILKKIKFKNAVFIPLVGIMFGNIIDSVTTFFAYKYDLVQNISAWLDGDFSRVIKGRYELLYISIPLVIIAYLYANKFTIVGMGEDFSTNLGMNYERIVNIGICIVALVSAVVVITVGKIPFLGIIIPNIVTLYLGDDTKKNIPYIALLGAIFLMACDILGRIVIYPYEVSIGLTVGIIGSIIFLYLISRREVYGS